MKKIRAFFIALFILFSSVSIHAQIIYEQKDYVVAWVAPEAVPVGILTYDVSLYEYDINNLERVGERIFLNSTNLLEYGFTLQGVDLINTYYAIEIRANDYFNSTDHYSEWASSIVEKDCNEGVTFVIFYDFTVGKVRELKIQ